SRAGSRCLDRALVSRLEASHRTDIRDAAPPHAGARRVPPVANHDTEHEGNCESRWIQQRQPIRSRLQDGVRCVTVAVSRRVLAPAGWWVMVRGWWFVVSGLWSLTRDDR